MAIFDKFLEFVEGKEAILLDRKSLFSSCEGKGDGRIGWQRVHELTKSREEGMPTERQKGMFLADYKKIH
jgi:hypothetical protein